MATRKALNPLFRAERAALRNAIGRCHNPDHQSYYNYGARGIEVHPDWRAKDGFDKFMQHIGPKLDRKLTLDRIDNDKGYEPGNVRWVDRKTQQKNRRRRTESGFKASDLVQHNGKSQSWSAWASELGLQLAAIRQRVARGLPIEEALAPRLRKSKKSVCVNDTDYDLAEWCKLNGLNYTQVSWRLKNGTAPLDILYGKRKPQRRWGKLHEMNGVSLTVRGWAEQLGCNEMTLR